MRKSLKYIFAVVMITVTLIMSGCGSLNRYSGTAVNGKSDSEAKYVESMDELESGCFYIHHNGKYYKPAWGELSFKSGLTGKNVEHTTFFDDDTVGTIPTLCSGDYLVYYIDESFKETFTLDRFQYIGYTLGICNLKQTSSGRYSFDAYTSNISIDKTSDANKLTALNAKGVIIDTIGKAELRSGNISDGGVILGLKPNGYYTTEVYVGTELTRYTLCADSIAFTSMESITTNDFTFLKSKIVRINIPSSLNSGYYAVNGSGLFRYVNGYKYDENTDFNVPNDTRNFVVDKVGEEKTIQVDSKEEFEAEFTVQRESDIHIVVTYENEEYANFDYGTPVVKVVGTDAVYTIEENKRNCFDEVIHLPTGRYKLVISGMGGRAYEYQVSSKE